MMSRRTTTTTRKMRYDQCTNQTFKETNLVKSYFRKEISIGGSTNRGITGQISISTRSFKLQVSEVK